MKQITWEVSYLSPPHITRYCKKCGTKTKYRCSNAFRVNAQKKTIDIWLIYKCVNCDSTWNMEVYTRISPKSIDAALLEGFHCNNEDLALQCAMDARLLSKNSVTMCPPDYVIHGDDLPYDEPVELVIRSAFPTLIKVASLIRQKTGLSQSRFANLAETGAISSMSGGNISKMTVKEELRVMIHHPLM